MYRIVVADDEVLEREAQQQALLRLFGDECRIELASTGRAALEAVLRLHADLAILDIEMPGMNGLEAARAIRAQSPDCRIIFLTAYGEFGYAKQAVELGAIDYLLKPCSDEQMGEVLRRVTDKIEEQRAMERDRERSSQRIENLTQSLEEQLVLTVLGGYLRPEWVQSQLEELGVGFQNGAFLILTSPDDLDAERIRGLVRGRVWPAWLHLIMYEYDDRLYVLAVSANEQSCIDRVTEGLSELSEKIGSILEKRLYCAVSRRFEQLREAQNAFFQAQAMLPLCSDERRLRRFDEMHGANEPHSSGLTGTICQHLLDGEGGQAERAVVMTLEGLCAQQLDFDTIVEKMERRLERVLDRLQSESSIDFGKRYHPREQLGSAQDVDQLRDAACTLIRELGAEAGSSRSNRMSQIMQEIEEYMRQNYRRDIFLQQVAREMNYSDAYFSKLFKQCFNKNFITYLTEARISAAKDLLRCPTVNIKEVGAQVGYKDSNYFTKVFRRATGKSPSEYRSSVTGVNTAQENMPS